YEGRTRNSFEVATDRIAMFGSSMTSGFGRITGSASTTGRAAKSRFDSGCENMGRKVRGFFDK
ncbi:MAG: hypothetical protein K2F99_08605, partial [Muribaculaceae bacterium]|nr:hypothetical protein [Muribaculaceae bacterium]